MSRSYCHRGGDVPLLGATIPEHFLGIVQRFPDNEAAVFVEQGRRLTYAQLKQAVDEVARGLLGLGFGKGSRIGVWSTNNLEWLLLQHATARIGAILVNVNPAYRVHELVYALKRSEVEGLFLIPSFKSSNYVAMLLEAVPELENGREWKNAEFPHLRHVVLWEPSGSLETVRPKPGLIPWPELLAAGSEVTAAALDAATTALDPDDPINIQYTSGTTGFPKAVLLSHHNILNNAWFAARAMRFGERDRLVVPVPFYHCFGMVLANLLCMSVGAAMVVPGPHFDPLATLQAIHNERCTAVHGVPTMFIAQLEHPRFAEFDLTSLRTGIMAGAPCPPALMTRVMEAMHCREILIGYGETEASPLTHLTEIGDSLERRTETVGRNLPHQEVKVVGTADGHTVGLGEVGEICFRGYHVMHGYYGDEAATKKAIDAGHWLHSGDLGTMDAEGYVRITGRLKDMIIRGGENIYPAEIEEYLFSHPAVAQVAVFGVPDEFYGEEVMAWVQLKAGAAASEDDLRGYCKGKIAHYKVPKYIWFVEAFPMTVTGKLQKFRMREMAMEKLSADAA